MEKHDNSLSILYLITDLKFGGAQKVLFHILNFINHEKFRPTVACLFGGNSPIADEIRKIDIPVIDLGMQSKWKLIALYQFYRLLCSEKPVILHSSLYHANIIARILGRLAGVPVIVTWRHNVNIGGKIREAINRWTAWLDDCTVAVSELIRQVEIKKAHTSSQKVITIYNGIDTRPFMTIDQHTPFEVKNSLGIRPEVLLLGTVSRLHPQKGLTKLLEAMPKILQKFPEVSLLLVGEGELRKTLEAQARSLGISDDVILTGNRTDIPYILTALDIFVFPSLWEGLSLALLEAMAAGLPVIATSVGSTPEVVINGVTGYLVPPNDSEALASAILHLLENPRLRHQMGQAGRQRVQQKYDIRSTISLFEDLYIRLLAKKNSR